MGLLLFLFLVSSSFAQYQMYWHNWADDEGVTHFTLCNFTGGWKPASFGPGQTPIFIESIATNMTLGVKIFYTPHAWVGEGFHQNPVTQWGLVTTGQMKFVSGDGTVVYLRPGDIYFGDDVGSKGHHSENSGQGPVLLWQLQMKPDWKKSFENAGKTGPCWPSM